VHAAVKLAIGSAGLAAVVLGVAAGTSQGESGDPAGTSAKAGATTRFVDRDTTTVANSRHYSLPDLAPGWYSVSLYTQMEPADPDIPEEAMLCTVNDVGGKAVVSDITSYNGEWASPLQGTIVYRVTKNSDLTAGCSVESTEFHYVQPLQIDFTRLGAVTTATLH
jgi:hypothetical protein